MCARACARAPVAWIHHSAVVVFRAERRLHEACELRVTVVDEASIVTARKLLDESAEESGATMRQQSRQNNLIPKRQNNHSTRLMAIKNKI